MSNHMNIRMTLIITIEFESDHHSSGSEDSH